MTNRNSLLAAFIAASLGLLGCNPARVHVTKTGKGYHEPTDPDFVEILMTIPDRPYVELGTVTVTEWRTDETAKMHNALRNKAAPLGASAVILVSSGITDKRFWGTGLAVRFTDQK